MLEKLKVRTGMMLVLACFVITLALACGLSWMNADRDKPGQGRLSKGFM